MEIHRYEIPYSHRGSKFDLFPLGDIHLGTKNCDKDKLQETIDYIKNTPNTFWIGMGDYAEFITVSDSRCDLDNIDPEYQGCLGRLPSELAKDLTELFEPIKDKCVGLHCGNHEERIRKDLFIDITYELCRNLGVKYLGYSAFTRLTFARCESDKKPGRGERHSFDIFSTHGNVAGRKSGGKINRLEDMTSHYDADIILIAHGHKKVTGVVNQIGLSRGSGLILKDRKKVIGMTGSFYKAYTEGTISYAEKCGFPPSSLGAIKVTLLPDKGKIHISE